MHWLEEEDEEEEEEEREREFVVKCEQQRGAQAVQQQRGAVQAEGRILRRSAMQCNAI